MKGFFMSVTVVGSVGLDTVETPSGRSEEGLGGAAVYFSLAACHFDTVHLVGVVGEDFPEEHVTLMRDKGINLDGLERAPGRTFRWTGHYHEDLNNRDTLETQLNVFESFHPKVPSAAQASEYLFLGNIHPSLQLEVLEQTRHTFAALDTMNLWIDITRDDLKAVLKRVDALIINDAEAKQLTERHHLRHAALDIMELGPKTVVIKKGEHGCFLFGPDGEVFGIPALLLDEVVDPTGAGDSFAGGFMGSIAQSGRTDFEAMKQAVVHGSALASFTCEAFGPSRLAAVDQPQIDQRVLDFRTLMHF